MPVSVPHVVCYRPLVTLILTRLSALNAGLLEAFLNHNLADFPKRNLKTLPLEDCMQLSCTALIPLPLLNYKVVEFRAYRLKEPARLMVLETRITPFLILLLYS